MNIPVLTPEEIRSIIRSEFLDLLPSLEKNPIPKQRFYLEEAAQYCRMPIPTFRIHRFKIGGAKIGKRWTFTKDELDRYIEKHSSRAIGQ